MQTLMLLLICVVTSADFLTVTLRLPGIVRFAPEALSVAVVIAVILLGIRNRFRFVAARYWLVFAAITFIIICGIASNAVGSGPTLAGMRFYLRAIPLFLLPAVFPFAEEQLKTQFRLVLGIGLLQLPFAVFQRWRVMSQGRFTGDEVFGTLMDSGILSIFMVCCVLVLTGLFLKGRLSKWRFLGLGFLLLLPTTINETKGTVLFLPMGLFVTMLVGAARGRRIRIAFGGLALLVVFGAIFVPVYNAMQAHNPYKKDILEFFTDQKQIEGYVAAKNAGLGTTKQVGRADAIATPVEYVSRDPVHFAFGLGIGNASHSSMGANFQGIYYDLFKSFLITSFSVFVLEIGVLGVSLIFIVYWMIFRDVLAVARIDARFVGAVAPGWAGAVAVIAIGTLYTTTHIFDSASYFFWYFSGIFAARRMQLAGSSVESVAA